MGKTHPRSFLITLKILEILRGSVEIVLRQR